MKSVSVSLIGIALCAAGICLIVCLAGYTAADPPEFAGFPRQVIIQNYLGLPGAIVAAILLNLFGYAAYLLAAPLAIHGIRLLRGADLPSQLIAQPVMQLTGSLLVGIGSAGLFTFLPDWMIKIPCPLIGPGGYSGIVLSALLISTVAAAGTVIFLISMILAGLVLTGDQILFRLLCLFLNREPEKVADERPKLMPRKSTININVDEEEYGEEEYEEYEEEEYELPTAELLEPSEPTDEEDYSDETFALGQLLIETLATFKIKAQVVDVKSGPTLSQYELRLEKGTRINKIQVLENDLGMELKTGSVRIVAPIPGKNTVGVELPNEHRQIVRLRDVIELSADTAENYAIPLFLGKGVTGDPIAADLASMPHLLIAGQTGTGKSVCLNSIIVSMLMTRSPDEVQMIMIDPKRVELCPYRRIPHLICPVIDDMQKAAGTLGWVVNKMEERYDFITKSGVRNISEYNELSEDELRRRMNMIDGSEEEWDEIPKYIPYMVVILDEAADLIRTNREVESHIIRLAQKSRGAGIHLILATQKPTADAFSSSIKSNLPGRIAFQVSSKTDSMVIFDQTGAERLLGKGDMLFKQNNVIVRGQGALITNEEIEAVMKQIGTDSPNFDEELLDLDNEESDGSWEGEAADERGKIDRDDVYFKAVDLFLQKGKGTVSMLQTCLGIGYPRASRIMTYMQKDGIVGEADGAKPRKVLISMDEWRRRRSGGVRIHSTNIESDYEEEDDYVAM